MLAKLEALGLVLVDLAIAIEHVARHKGAVALGEVLCRPGSLEQRQRIAGFAAIGTPVDGNPNPYLRAYQEDLRP